MTLSELLLGLGEPDPPLDSKTMKYYRVDGHSGWFVVRAPNMTKAKSAGVAEFGRCCVKSVAEATKEDMANFVEAKGVSDGGEEGGK